MVLCILDNLGGNFAIGMINKEMIISGIFTGVSGIFARIGMMLADPGMTLITQLIFNPFLWISSAFGIAGFAYLQKALHKAHVSLVEPTITSIAITTPVILGVIFLDELITVLKWIGIGLIIIGVIGIGEEDGKESPIDALFNKLK